MEVRRSSVTGSLGQTVLRRTRPSWTLNTAITLTGAFEICSTEATLGSGKVDTLGTASVPPHPSPPGVRRPSDGGGWSHGGWAGRRSYLGALVEQRLCKCSPDALRRAGHQRYFAVHVHGEAAAPAAGGRAPSPSSAAAAAAAFMAPGARVCSLAGRPPASGRG